MVGRPVKIDDAMDVPAGVDDADLYRLAVAVLKRSGEDEPMPVTDLISKIAAHPENQTPRPKIYAGILGFTRIVGSRISSRKGRTGGYFLRPLEAVTNALPTPAEQKREKTYERHLWPVIAQWLRLVKQVEKVSCDIANIKSGGVWSNPDIVGFNIVEDIGFYDVEVTTIEVKPSLQNWRYYFFEAVSHKRFSERVYFIYRDDGTSGAELRLELLRYAEKYGVGLAEVQLDDLVFDSLQRWERLSDDERAKILEAIVEVMPAPFEAISIRSKIDFFRQLGIESKPDLYAFGK